MDELEITEKDGAVVFRVKVAPRSKRNAFSTVHDGAVKVSLTAPPVDGAANEALVAFVAEALDVPKRAVTIAQGKGSRTKTIAVRGVTVQAVRALACGSDGGERAPPSKEGPSPRAGSLGKR